MDFNLLSCLFTTFTIDFVFLSGLVLFSTHFHFIEEEGKKMNSLSVSLFASIGQFTHACLECFPQIFHSINFIKLFLWKFSSLSETISHHHHHHHCHIPSNVARHLLTFWILSFHLFVMILFCVCVREREEREKREREKNQSSLWVTI